MVPKYSKEAEDLLSKAIKLDPKLVEAWNELGECYWKNNKLKEAINCFSGALKHVSIHLLLSDVFKENVCVRGRIKSRYATYRC